MKLSHSTLLAILATSAVVSAAPSPVVSQQALGSGLVKKSDISDALSIIQELGELKGKRDQITDDETQLFELSKRADSLVSQLLTALANSGIIGNVWTIITTDTQFQTVIKTVVKAAFQGALTYGPSLIKAIWSSGLLQSVFKTIFTNSSIKSVLLLVAKSIFGSGLNLLKAYLAKLTGGSTTTTTAVSTTTTAAVAAKREVAMDKFDDNMYYDKRDLVSVAETVVSAIKSTGIVQSLVAKAVADPDASILFLETVFKEGLVVSEDIYEWTKDSGLLTEGLDYIAKSGNKYAADIAEFLGSEIAGGNATVSDIDNAGSVSSAAAAAQTTTVSTSTSTATVLAKRMLY